jgi:gliding motility associated protien GldN
MNATIKFACLAAFALLAVSLPAQDTDYVVTESGTRVTQETKPCAKPRDGFYDRYLSKEKMPLPYDFVHEKDVFWEKRIWRELDTREKMNQPFTSPHNPLINVMIDAAKLGDITLYSTWDDQFSTPLSQKDIMEMLYSSDTITIFDPETLMDSMVIVQNEFNWEDVQKFRLKEVWFFDEETSTLGVRILGIAPIITRYDDDGNFLHTAPMFWAYYPDLRTTFAQSETFNPVNDAARLSWDDLFEARMFSSYIIKENNIHDRRIKDYATNDTNALLEGERIHGEIFNFEHDLWDY